MEIKINNNDNDGATKDDIKKIGQLTISSVVFLFQSRARDASIKALATHRETVQQ